MAEKPSDSSEDAENEVFNTVLQRMLKTPPVPRESTDGKHPVPIRDRAKDSR